MYGLGGGHGEHGEEWFLDTGGLICRSLFDVLKEEIREFVHLIAGKTEMESIFAAPPWTQLSYGLLLLSEPIQV
jgi:hypothetical protein